MERLEFLEVNLPCGEISNVLVNFFAQVVTIHYIQTSALDGSLFSLSLSASAAKAPTAVSVVP
jgi:hypothetical protein